MTKTLTNLFISLSLLAVLLVSSLVALNLSAAPVLGQTNSAKQICLGSGGEWTEPDGPCTTTDGSGNIFGPNGLFLRIVNTLLFLVGAIAIVMIIIGAIRYVTSAGDQNAVTGAKNTILYAVIGLIVALLAFGLVNFVLTSLT